MRECEYDDEVDSERDSDDDYNEDEVMCMQRKRCVVLRLRQGRGATPGS